MIIGNYEIVRQIGEGGFGRTYEARHVWLDEKACLKQNINLTPEDTELLRKEAKVLWQVHHYALPGLRDFFKAPDSSWVLAMSFIDGKPLDKIIQKHKALHPEEVCWISQRLLNGLYYLHNLGIVHGDVKPPNVIVQPRQHNAVLVDYGLSTLRPHHKSAAAGFTPVFAPPEVTEGKPPLPESDLYSLGLTMIYALGGDPVTKLLPDYVPKPLAQFCLDLSKYDALERPHWGKEDLVQRLNDVRYEVFGRRSSLKT